MKESKKVLVIKIIALVFVSACMVVPAIMHILKKVDDMELKGSELIVMPVGIVLAVFFAGIIIFKFIKSEPKN